MSLPRYMILAHSGHYRYRRVVPTPIREALGCREIKKALGRDYTEAVRRYAQVHKEAETALREARAREPIGERSLVIRRMRQAGFTANDIALVAAGRVEAGTMLDDAMEKFHEDLVEQNYEQVEAPALAEGWSWSRKPGAKVSLDALKAIGRKELPKETHTVATALDHYLDMRSTGVHAYDLALKNRVNLVRERMQTVLGKYEVTQRPLEQLTRAEARKFRDYLAGEMSAPSVKRTLEIISPAINRLIREHDIDMKNPFASMEVRGATNSRGARVPLADDDMKALASIMETADALGAIWTTLRDTGARLGEVSNLRVIDVDTEAKAISIRAYGDHRLKTKNSERTVPLSSAALESLKRECAGKAGEDVLFRSYAGPRRAEAASAALMKRLRTVVKDGKKTIHSLRHRMKDRLRDTQCAESLAREIMGHSEQAVAFNYGSGFALQRKREALEKVWQG
ncbi:Phage integrase family protein [Mesorhizobium albiziae]|uniref:Phage integrase family protein n=1 Tax=Neomesorhizobium albiziae TaxID=335020 RepID=A0A1I4EBZ4_9HYPH|nr:site-specific integrase [Mesorhizobium albiziae]GLS33804.1 hypothetical protein GCM10007937_55170 [Mesorhizobium albiziae]SFL01701.1 Phage integrase family protein [Mesorhizobium albiziae]